ncbi:MAG: hypothetical protein WAX07_00930 [Candidatus Altiarchaeia archaeon]
MKQNRIIFFSAIILINLFSGCLGQNDGCSDPYVKIGDSCCVDGDGNGVCDKEEAPTTTKEDTTTTLAAIGTSTTLAPTTTLPETTIATTTTAGRTTTTLKTCKAASDCGVSYLGGCTCQGDGVTRTVYKPVCNAGTCIWKGDAQIDKCRDGSGSSEKEHCVSGYARCIPDSEYEEYFIMPDDAELLEGLTYGTYSVRYQGYRFKTNGVLFPEDSKCFDDLQILIGVMKPNGKETEIEVLRGTIGKVDDIEIGLEDIKRTDNGTVAPRMWIREV